MVFTIILYYTTLYYATIGMPPKRWECVILTENNLKDNLN